MAGTDEIDDRTSGITRRRVVAGLGATVATGGGVLALTDRDPVRAEVTMGELAIDDEAATVAGPPEKIRVSASGEFDVESSAPVERVDCILQVEVDGTADDLATDTDFEDAAGTYDVAANLYDHRAVSTGDLTPADGPATTETDLTVRIVCAAIVDGEIAAEAVVEEAVTLAITREGMTVSVGGSGSVDVVTPTS